MTTGFNILAHLWVQERDNGPHLSPPTVRNSLRPPHAPRGNTPTTTQCASHRGRHALKASARHASRETSAQSTDCRYLPPRQQDGKRTQVALGARGVNTRMPACKYIDKHAQVNAKRQVAHEKTHASTAPQGRDTTSHEHHPTHPKLAEYRLGGRRDLSARHSASKPRGRSACHAASPTRRHDHSACHCDPPPLGGPCVSCVCMCVCVNMGACARQRACACVHVCLCT